MSIGPSGAEVAGVAIATGAVVGTAVALEIHHTHHTLKGCVFSAPNGLELQSGSTPYLLSGDLAGIDPGHRVLVHGTRLKPAKHTAEAHTFQIQKLGKVYGPCSVSPRLPQGGP